MPESAFHEYYHPYLSGTTCVCEPLLAYKSKPILRSSKRHIDQVRRLFEQHALSFSVLSWYQYAICWPSEISIGEPIPGYTEGLFYPMNASSLIPVLALDVQPDEVVLDACAAPGGKTLMIAERINFTTGHLVANDVSRERVIRLKQVLKTYTYPSVEVSHIPAETIYMDLPNTFDKILLDAPCSSEKHVYRDKKELAKWSPKRIKKLRTRQYGLIDKLIRALKPGGRLVYSTCAITPDENELVVSKILKNRADQVRLVPWELDTVPGGPGLPGDYPVSFALDSVRRVPPMPKQDLDPMFVAVFEKK